MTEEKIKRKEIPAAKNALRGEIECIATELRDLISRPQAIPESVVNGSLACIQDYKQCAEDVATMYHANHSPGDSMSLLKLKAVRDKLRAKLNTLKGVAQ